MALLQNIVGVLFVAAYLAIIAAAGVAWWALISGEIRVLRTIRDRVRERDGGGSG